MKKHPWIPWAILIIHLIASIFFTYYLISDIPHSDTSTLFKFEAIFSVLGSWGILFLIIDVFFVKKDEDATSKDDTTGPSA